MHWYDDFGWFGSAYGSNVLENIHQSHPDKWILNTEGCVYKPSNGETNFIGNWQDGDYYARDIIDNLNHWSTGWVDWNMVLNEDRGPLWNMSLDTGTIVDAPIIIKNDGTEFYKNPAYYIMGHFSKFIVPNSTRVNMNLNQSVDSPVQGVSFLTPSNQIVTVLYNWNNITNYTVSLQTKGSNNWINLQLEKLSITTLIWNQVTTTAAPSTSATNLAGNVWICVFSIITFLLR
uniref:Glucosylceramidase n=1 Tax=Acrobeloides nanus TaxID=290746 RepID=A0A914DVQ4_9BILA